MDTITFDKLLLKTAFCCMASDGDIDKREIDVIQMLCKNSELFKDFDFQSEINKLIQRINEDAKVFVINYLDLLKNVQLNKEEELTLIDFALRVIHADEQLEYSEIKFFKNIRHRLSLRDDEIIKRFKSNYNDIEEYLEQDIIIGDFLGYITKEFFELSEIPKFDNITIEKE